MNCVYTGRRGEDLAAVFLFEKDYRILARNWRTRAGEIDIIAWKEGVIVFCEVKSRSSKRCGSGAESVHRRKQMKIIQVALLYLQKTQQFEAKCRFDVIEIDTTGESETIRHIVDAFQV